MMKKLLAAKNKSTHDKEKQLLSLELAEIKEVSDMLFQRLEQKIRVLEAIEASVDKKITDLERLIQRAEFLKAPGGAGGGMIRQHEILTLSKRGMKTAEIAEILGTPVGEVELILGLNPLRT